MPDTKEVEFNQNLIKARINGEENHHVEFKSSFSFDYANQKRNKDLEFEIPKTVNAFANNEGGTLFIGVNDKGEILGLENDMSILNKDFDKLQRTIVQKISNSIQDSRKEIFYTSEIEEEENKKFIVIHVYRSENAPNQYIKLTKELIKKYKLSKTQKLKFFRNLSQSDPKIID